MKNGLSFLLSFLIVFTISLSPIIRPTKVHADPVYTYMAGGYYLVAGLLSLGVANSIYSVLKNPFSNRRESARLGAQILEGSNLIETNHRMFLGDDLDLKATLGSHSSVTEIQGAALNSVVKALVSGDIESHKFSNSKESWSGAIRALVGVNSSACNNWMNGGKMSVPAKACFLSSSKDVIAAGINNFENPIVFSEALLVALGEAKDTSQSLEIFRKLNIKDKKSVSRVDKEIIYNFETVLLISSLIEKISQSYVTAKQEQNIALERQYTEIISYLSSVSKVALLFTSARASALGVKTGDLRVVADNFWTALVSDYLKSEEDVAVLDNLLQKISLQKVNVKSVKTSENRGILYRVFDYSIYHTLAASMWAGSAAILAMVVGDHEIIETVIKPSLELIYSPEKIASLESSFGMLSEYFTGVQNVAETVLETGSTEINFDKVQESFLVEAAANAERGAYGVFAGLTFKGILNTTEYLTQNMLTPNGRKQIRSIVNQLHNRRSGYYKAVNSRTSSAKKAINTCVKVLTRNNLL